MIGKTLAHYKIIDKLGEGGMGVVYRAHDSKLGREVAVKVLPQEMSGDPERAARFAREARTLASLQHPNIASVYGYEDVGGTRFLVMELVEGEDLQQRLARGAIAVDDAIDIATQIANGLEAAHDQNIVHRDLKPANIKVTPTGEVKILDFGLARAYLGDDGSNPELSHSPTITAAMTSAGVILGTAAYMSPEQARGKPVDRRSDMWAFGVILFEMLTGTRLFSGETVSDTLAAVLRAEPDFDELPASTPAGVLRLLRRCLQRDPRLRIRSAGDAVLDLTDTETVATSAAAISTRAPRWILGVIGALVLALAASLFLRPAGETPGDSTRSLHLDIALPEGRPLGPAPPSLSPDGKWLAFTAQDSLSRSVLYLRSLDRFAVEAGDEVEIDNSAGGGVGIFFWSPDCKRLGIQTSDAIVIMDIATRVTQKLNVSMAFARGAAWSPNGTIIFAPTSNSGLFALASFEASPEAITSIDTARADASHRWPVFLPDGERFLFTTWSNAAEEQSEIGGIYVGGLDGREPTRLLRDVSQVLVDPAGHLLFHRKGNLMQVAFDFESAAIRGAPTVVATDVDWNVNNGLLGATVSWQGDLVLSSAGTESSRALGWLTRDGTFTRILDISGAVSDIFLATDGRHAALDRISVGSSLEIWIADLERGTLSLLSRSGSDCWGGAFSPDGRRYVYTSQDPGFERLYEQGIDGATAPTALLDLKSVGTRATQWSPNNELLFDYRARSGGAAQIWVYDFETKQSRAVLADQSGQASAALSPDGRWLAYASDESGRREVYVRPYPELNRKWQISTRGGDLPHWRDDGHRLLYNTNPTTYFGVDIAVEAGQIVASHPMQVAAFDNKYRSIVPDAKHERFLCTMGEDTAGSRPFRFISNWRAVLAEGAR